MKKLFLITGASGKLGEAFLQQTRASGNDVFAFSRKPIETVATQSFVVDLLDEPELEKALNGIAFAEYDNVVLIHTVGKFKFEGKDAELHDEDGDGIDDEVYKTNVVTTKNVLKFLLPRILPGLKLKVCVFASISDKHNIPFWTSYTKAKNILREYLRSLCQDQQIAALVVNVSTVDTGNENILRPKADKTFWLKPEEVATQALDEIEKVSEFKEIDIFKKKPDFNESYYVDHDALLEKWHREMGTQESSNVVP